MRHNGETMIYYQDENSVLYCGDSALVLKELPDKSIDLTVTSPPYDNLRTYKGFTFDFETIAKELYRVTKDGGVVVWVVNDATIDGSETLTSCKQKIFFREQCGFNIYDTMIYQSDKPPVNQKRYENCFEYMIVLSRGQLKTFNPIKVPKMNKDQTGKKIRQRQPDGTMRENIRKKTFDKLINNIWYYQTGGQTIDHPAIYPEQLVKDHILSWSNEGDTVLDCFCGSGTTLKAAKILKRKSIGIEIAKEYCELIVRRINKPIPLFDEKI